MKPLYTIPYIFNRKEALKITLAISNMSTKTFLKLLFFYILSAFFTVLGICSFSKGLLEFPEEIPEIILILFFTILFLVLTYVIYFFLKGTLFNKNIFNIETTIDLYEDYYMIKGSSDKKYMYEDEKGKPFKFLNKIYYLKEGNNLCTLYVDTSKYSKEICDFIDSKLNVNRNHL